MISVTSVFMVLSFHSHTFALSFISLHSVQATLSLEIECLHVVTPVYFHLNRFRLNYIKTKQSKQQFIYESL